jgi:tryptophan-rich sensory protein
VSDAPRGGPRSGLVLAGLALACFGVSATGAAFPPGEWYASLAKPSWTPPSWIFPPVWTLLYASMAVAAWLVWREAGFAGARTAFVLFGGQLALNGAWSWIFFGLHEPGWAFVDIVLLKLAILGTIIAFFVHRPAAGLLLIPYWAWVTFALWLNLSLWQMNP